MNGRWNSNYWNWGAFGAGVAAGGLLGWGLGSAPYYWGYSSYSNPYYVPASQVVVADSGSAPAYDYSQPINTETPPPSDDVADPAVAIFDSAREQFMQGSYSEALNLVEQAIKQLPNDATLHEFRALTLFALGRYDEAAATLYPVLSVGPGWDWTTLIGLYPNVDVYTKQLRALEQYSADNPDSASANFLLAYHYLTAGHTDAAAKRLKKVVELKPNDTLAAALLKQLDPNSAPAAPASPPTAPAVPAIQFSPANLAGTWTAKPSGDTTIELTFSMDGSFVWNVNQKGQEHKIQGQFTLGNDLLTLAQGDDGTPMVGRIEPRSDKEFVFRLAGGPPNDPGLTFAR